MTVAEDLKPRTKRYALSVIRLYKALPKTQEEVRILGRQFLRSGTSAAANYREASRARSRAEFISKTEICAQEADETQLWMELLKEGCGVENDLIDAIWKESDELISIFVTMSKNTKGGSSS